MHCDISYPTPRANSTFSRTSYTWKSHDYMWLYVTPRLVPLLCASRFACHSFLSIAASIFLYLACSSLTNRRLYSSTSVTELPRAFLYKSFPWHEPSSLSGHPLQVQLYTGADLALGDCLHPCHQSVVLLVIHIPSSTCPVSLSSS